MSYKRGQRETVFPPQNPVPLRQSSLEDTEWYWGDISRHDAKEKMSGTPDGTFLVRNSIAKGENCYTLTVRHGGSDKLLTIYSKDGRVGFTEPYSFDSVCSLVSYHQRHSLASFNKALDIQLLYPVSKFNSSLDLEDVPPPGERDDVQDVFTYIQALIDYRLKMEERNNMTNEQSRITELTQEKLRYILVFNGTIEMLEDHVKASFEHLQFIPPVDKRRVQENTEITKSRLRKAVETRRKIENEIVDLTKRSRSLYNEMNVVRRNITDLERRCEQLKPNQTYLNGSGKAVNITLMLDVVDDWLQNSAHDSPHRDQLFSRLRSMVLELSASGHLDTSKWLDLQHNREQVERLLANKKVGTFAIRKSQDGGYALSIVCTMQRDVTVVHCRIEQSENCFGFSEPFIIHKTLTDLVLHYREISLFEHNDQLDVKLEYPLYGPQPF